MFFDNENISSEKAIAVFQILNSAKLLIETKVKPDLERKIQTDVLNLKNQGMSKVKIASSLGISKGSVDKYFDSK